MKSTILTYFGLITLFVTSVPIRAQQGTEAELLALEADLDQEQEKLNERRKELDLRKLQLRTEGGSVPGAAETPTEAAARVALLRSHAQASRSRTEWIEELGTLGEKMNALEKGEGRLGGPRPFGPKAKALEEGKQARIKVIELRRQQLENLILTSMQTILTEKGALTDAEYKWLESQISQTKGAPTAMDDATQRWAQLVLNMEKDRRNLPPPVQQKGPLPVAVE